MTRTIAIANQKGGVGKTTTAINLSACLTKFDRSVLLIDLDPQSHCSIGLGIPAWELKFTIYDVIIDNQTMIEDVLVPAYSIDVVPANISLASAEIKLQQMVNRENRLLRKIEKLTNPYDYIIIDCPPSLGLLTLNALRACQELIVPIDTGIYSLQGVSRLAEVLQGLKENFDQDFTIYALATLFDRRTNIGKETLDRIKEMFKENAFKTVIHTNVKLKEAAAAGKPITIYDPSSSGYYDYLQLAEEIISLEPGKGAAKNGKEERKKKATERV